MRRLFRTVDTRQWRELRRELSPDYPYPELMIFMLDHKQLPYKILNSCVSQKHLLSKYLILYFV